MLPKQPASDVMRAPFKFLGTISPFAPSWQTGAVLGRKWQPHEAHVPYILQFKLDFSLFGMGFLRLSKGLFRWDAGNQPG